LAAGWDVPQSLIDDLLSQLSRRSGTIAGGIGSATMTGLSALGTLGTILLIALFLTIFALTSGDNLWRSIRAAFPARRR
ncbi:hypothetical protein Q0N68_14515, partial [Staphylococcus aureus]|nr:hypothetical protein [Staphylococcus aureus]